MLDFNYVKIIKNAPEIEGCSSIEHLIGKVYSVESIGDDGKISITAPDINGKITSLYIFINEYEVVDDEI
jgi:hypothetical protein